MTLQEIVARLTKEFAEKLTAEILQAKDDPDLMSSKDDPDLMSTQGGR